MTEELKETQTEVMVEEIEATMDNGNANESENEQETQATLTPEALAEALQTAQAEATKNLEGWQRTAADLANYKRRQEEQASRQRADLIARILQDILPALDDLDLAFQNLPDTLAEKESNWVEGFGLVQRKLTKVLDNNNIQVIATDGIFDPNLHEAVTYEESPEHESNTIIAELRKGYSLGERVLRPALVRVAQ